MSQPAHVTISRNLPAHLDNEIDYLVRLAAEISRVNLATTEVHVKLGSRKYAQTTGYAYYTLSGKPFADEPHSVQAQPGVRFLVTLKLQPGFDDFYQDGRACPGRTRIIHYWRYVTAPHTPVHSWQEEFVYIACHEFNHIRQYLGHCPIDCPNHSKRHHYTHSEIECEHAAVQGLETYRVLAPALARSAIGKAAHT